MKSLSNGLPNKNSTFSSSVLIVEDNDDDWFLTQWALSQIMPQVEIIRVINKEDTLAFLENCFANDVAVPKLILLDLYLPRREDGWLLLETIKTHHLFRCLPVIVLSNSQSPEDIEESYYLRGNSFIVKPQDYRKRLSCFKDLYRYWWKSANLPFHDNTPSYQN